MSALITLSSVEKVYGFTVRTVALKVGHLEIDRGELVVILGPSGSGKSTLLNLIGGLDAPTCGSVQVDGVDLAALSPQALTDFRRAKIGFVFQFFNLIPSLTARENVEFAAEMTATTDHVAEKLAAVGLGGRLDHFPGQLSGGEQQRVAIARALVKNPPLLLCDEPTGALDMETGKSVLGILQSLAIEEGKTVVIVTHNAAVAGLATRLIRLKDGEIASDERPGQTVAARELRW